MRNYLHLLRLDHWFKNIFALPGVLFAVLLTESASPALLPWIALFFGLGFIASANYVINEWLDARFDRNHPTKRERACAKNDLSSVWVLALYLGCLGLGLWFGSLLGSLFLGTLLFFAVMGFLYNVRPFRLKEVPYLDLLSESVNNPIRFLAGWFAVSAFSLPPTAVLLAYWFAGAYLMTLKRFAELRSIGDRTTARRYRKSFGHYTEGRLKNCAILFACLSLTTFAFFLMGLQPALLATLPFFGVTFAYYLRLSHRIDSPVQSPERLYREPTLALLVTLSAGVFLILSSTKLDFRRIDPSPKIVQVQR